MSDQTTASKAIDAALQHRDHDLTAILDQLDPGELFNVANAADRVRRACEQVHNGSQGEPAHHGRTRWDFSA